MGSAEGSQRIHHRGCGGKAEKNLRKIAKITAEARRAERKAGERTPLAAGPA
jgi:hypothetical protein